MFFDFFRFEVQFRLRQISTYVYFLTFFAFCLLAASVNNFGPGQGGKVFVNSPYGLGQIYLPVSAFGTLVLSGMFGMAILRDFKEGMYQILFTKPIRKLDYLGGRLLGTYFVAFLVFLSMPIGTLLGPYMPWADALRFGPNVPIYHFQPWLFFVSTQLVFCGALFFTIGALSRNLVIVYLQGVILLGIYLISASLVLRDPNNLNTFWPAVLDPIGLVTFSTTTRYWSITDKNTLLFALEGPLLYNRLLWLGLSLLSVIALFRFFPFSVEQLTARRARKSKPVEQEDLRPLPVADRITLPQVRIAPDSLSQLRALTGFRIRFITRELTFWAILILVALMFVIDARQAGQGSDSSRYPVTYIMVNIINGYQLFLLIITTLFAGELVWKDRDLRFDQLHDTTPSRNWVQLASQFLSLTFIQVAILAILCVLGVAAQASLGYFNFELHLYFKEIFLVNFAFILQYTLFTLLCHTLSPNKFLAHGIVIGINILIPVVYSYGFQDRLYLFFSTPNYTYSDMNGYGHFAQPLLAFNAYWTLFSLLLGVVALLFIRRGTDTSWSARLTNARQRFTTPVLASTILLAAAFVGTGAWIYYNTHVLNPYRDDDWTRRQQADYEKSYRQYAGKPQPKIIDVDLNVDIFPERRAFSATGTYILINRTNAPISDLYISNPNETLRSIKFDRASTLKSQPVERVFQIHSISPPLAPGEQMRMSFSVGIENPGFRNAGERNEFAYNGTFFDTGFFPGLGYNLSLEITEEQRRREFKLPPLVELPLPSDPAARMTNLFTPDADWVKFRATVSTSADQTALAPGYIEKQWTANGRNYYRYSMGDQTINNFYSFLSGNWQVRRSNWKDIPIEIYYQPGHEFNLDRMIESIQKSFAYYTEHFGPYQFRQYRVIEFPRYRSFAQSFPNTIPFSEGIGFIQRVSKPEDLDLTFYVSAHELAHQWWGHQAIGCLAQGSNMMSESLAQYSALMVLEKDYEPTRLRSYLRHELDDYLRGRGAERIKEPPLAYVQREGYVWYQKGSLIMYALKDYLGEERLNRALRTWLEAVRFQKPPYTNSLEFMEALRKETPPELSYLIHDMFEDIVLYDNRAVSATAQKRPDGKYTVSLKLATNKLHADGLGKESPLPINDPIDVAIFAGSRDAEKVLHTSKVRFTGPETTLEFTVDERPTRAGIDPFVKLIDRKPTDNTIEVEQRQ